MLIFRFIFRVISKIGLHALILRYTSGFSYCPVMQHYIPPLSEMQFQKKSFGSWLQA